MKTAKLMKRLAEVLDLERLDLPAEPHVVGLRFQPILDSLDTEALNITVVIDEATPEDGCLWPAVAPIEETIRAALRDAEIEDWPYFWYRKPSEPGPFPY